MPRKRPPLNSFGPEVLATLVRGSKEPLVLKTTYRKAVVFRRRLHELRAAMRETSHPLADIVARARIEITWGEKANFPPEDERRSSRNVRYPSDSDCLALLTIAPHDSGFRDQLLAAGVKADELDYDPLLTPPKLGPATLASAREEGEETLEDILQRFTSTSEVK